MSFLKVEGLTHIFGEGTPYSKTAIKNVSFSLEKGEILGIIGHTGSGKSTLVSHLNGLMKATSGKVLIDSKDIWENPKEIKKVRSKVGLVFQYPEYQLFEETVFKDIAFGPKNIGMTDEQITGSVLNAAKLMKIKDELLEKSPFDLSGGQKRRVAIAGVMAMEPEIIVFDEPTAGLDPKGRETIFKAIYDYRKEHNATVVIVSHSMEDIAAVCDKVLVMNGGEVAHFGTTREVFSNLDDLKKMGLNVPLITNVMLELKAKYKKLDANVLTVDEAVNSLLKLLVKGGKENA
ncbi:MAG: energy-coupling factor transporter ATPase [Clostridia bacterium]|nr:energy-coupling factor transporter ATPase [Clostridia bacterium]